MSSDPAGPFVRLQADLAEAFPTFPMYGRPAGFVYEPHVTIAEGAATGEPSVASAPAWESLPRTAGAGAIEVIVRADDGRWRLLWRIPLAGSGLRGRR